MAGQIFVVRHGRYDRGTTRLTEQGRTEDAPRARDDLVRRGLGMGAVVLSSSELRAVETAEVIAEGFGTEVIQSKKIAMGGVHPSMISDLDEMLATVMHEAGVEVDTDGKLVVVAHAPLVAAVARTDEMQVDFGQVAEYVPGTWNDIRPRTDF